MNDKTFLHRQIHPMHIQNGRVTSQAFSPMPKDGKRLSVDDGDLVSPEESYEIFINNGFCSIGVYSVTCQECKKLELEVQNAPVENNPNHAVIDFSSLQSNSHIKHTASKLRDLADKRGWTFRASK